MVAPPPRLTVIRRPAYPWAHPRARRALRRARRAGILIVGLIVGLPAAALALFLVAAGVGGALPRNPGWHPPERGVQLFIETNGVHTGIVLPVVSARKDWRETFPVATAPTKWGLAPTHIAVGWGEREVFLTVARWSDLRPATALRIATGGGPALLRVAPHVRPAPGPRLRPVRVRPAEYARIVRAIEAALPPLPPGTTPATRAVHRSTYAPEAALYDARGRYTLATNCNQWVGDTLADAGLRVGRWTPLASGVTSWFPAPEPTSRRTNSPPGRSAL